MRPRPERGRRRKAARIDPPPPPEPVAPPDDADEPAPLVDRGRLLGLDYGTKRIGVAVADETWTIVTPAEPFFRDGSRETDERQLEEAVTAYRPQILILGLPLHMDGGESAMSCKVRGYARWAAELLDVPIVFHDERLTSAAAEGTLNASALTKKQRKARIDSLAAAVMLRAYCEHYSRHSSG